MRILLISSSESIHTSRWLSRLQEFGVYVSLLDTHQSPIARSNTLFHVVFPEEIDSTTWRLICRSKSFGVVGLPIRVFLLIRFGKRLAEWLTDHQFDLINVHWLLNSMSLAATFQKKLPVVLTPWGSDILLPDLRRYSRLKSIFCLKAEELFLRALVKGSTSSICDAPHLRSRLIELGAKPSAVQIIQFGIDTSQFSSQARCEVFRDTYGAHGETVVFLSNRQLETIYDVNLLIEAVRDLNLREDLSNVLFWICGNGSLKRSLESVVADYGLTSRFRFLGRLPENELIKSVASADFYVSTSPTDGGVAASVAEAMACEVPVVISDFGANRAFLKGESAGFIFKSRNSRSLMDCIHKCITLDSGSRKVMGVVGRSIVSKENNYEIETQRVIAAYQQTIDIFQGKGCSIAES